MLSITKLQNLKAIHNTELTSKIQQKDVINHKTTKFESNSQLVTACDNRQQRCYQSQNYKFWKQFITPKASQIWAKLLLSITKLQILKAIHNYLWCKNISILVVINHKTTKFESNSQLKLSASNIAISCYQSQNYKIWKQFTTRRTPIGSKLSMLSITKLQNLKAIHNLGS